MSDIALVIKNNCFDINILNGDLETDNGLETAVAISVFTDKRVTDEELPDLEESKRGWWGDMYPEVDQDKIGSRLWTLEREKKLVETLRLSEDYTREALDWMLEDSIADSVDVVSNYDDNNFLNIDIKISRPEQDDSRFSVVWDEQKIRRVA
ncbi:MAG: phage GP46 family protein [Proteobacteria bacterium]|nr:phage GP46 family protein [Pseudomonadota bacterium]